MSFKKLNICKLEILNALEEMGFKEPSPIQKESIPYALDGYDIIGQAQTGTGKTAAFGIPIIHNTDVELDTLQHLIVVPTRELATQIFEQLKKISKFCNVRISLILGGISYSIQGKSLNQKPHIIVGTPGRINDYLLSKRFTLNNIKTFTLDEADELLNIGFQKEIDSIVSFLPKKRQNFFFTATFNKKTQKLADNLINNENFKNIKVSSGLDTSQNIKQEYLIVKEKNKFSALIKILNFYKPRSVLIFGRTKRRVDELNDALNSFGYSSAAIQGDMQQKEREVVMSRFREHKKNILVATDVVARGIDINHIEWIINFDLPQEIEYYTHRIGRSGRAGRVGYSLSFVKYDEIEHIKEISLRTKSKIEEIALPSDEEIYQSWRNGVAQRLDNILKEYNKNEENPSYLEDELEKKYSQKELSIILVNLLLNEKNYNKKVTLTPEPSVILKGQAKVRNFKNRINNFDKKTNRKPFDKKQRNRNNKNYKF